MDENDIRAAQQLRRRIDELTQEVGANEPDWLRTYLSRPSSGIPHVPGTTVPDLGTQFRQRSDMILVPVQREDQREFDGVSVYLTIDEYQVGLAQYPRGLMLAVMLALQPKHVHLEILAAFNLLTQDEDRLSAAQNAFRAFLNDATGVRFDRAVHPDPPERPMLFLGRHMVLRAMAFVLEADDYEPMASRGNPPWVDTVLLVHTLGSLLAEREPESSKIFGMPSHTFVQIELSAVFDQLPDPFVMLYCYSQIWRMYGPQVTNPTPRLAPVQMASEATGLDYLDLLSFGLSIFGFGERWESPSPATLPATLVDFMPSDDVDRFLSIASATVDDLAELAKADESGWGIHFLREKPLLRRDEDLVVLDARYAMHRTLSGLYWLVKDYELNEHGKAAAHKWHLTYTKMLETFVVDTLRQCAIPSRVKGDTTFYTEGDLTKVVKGRKVADVTMHFGSDICLFEIFGGELNFGRIDGGRLQSFERDARNAIVGKKASQLNDSIQTIMDRERKLTGFPAVKDAQFIPVVVVAEGFPMSPLADFYVEEALKANKSYRKLQLPNVLPLAVIDMFDVVALEGLASAGMSIAEVLRGWKTSPYHRYPLRFYINRMFQPPTIPARYLAPRAADATEALIDEMTARYQSRQHD